VTDLERSATGGGSRIFAHWTPASHATPVGVFPAPFLPCFANGALHQSTIRDPSTTPAPPDFVAESRNALAYSGIPNPGVARSNRAGGTNEIKGLARLGAADFGESGAKGVRKVSKSLTSRHSGTPSSYKCGADFGVRVERRTERPRQARKGSRVGFGAAEEV